MRTRAFRDFDLDIARTRIILSLLALLALYVDPSTTGGLFHLTGYALVTLTCHLAYGVATYVALSHPLPVKHLPTITTVLDLLFATAVTYFTEGQTSPSYIFFVFAILAAGMHSELRGTIRVTLCGVGLYLLVIAFSDKLAGFYIMRAVYLAIAGYLVGFLGQQRVNYEMRLSELDAQAERHSIARALHDSYVQSLAGINLRVESCRELLRRGRSEDASKELGELQIGVARQYDEVREYLRSLAGVDAAAASQLAVEAADPKVWVNATFSAPGRITERILQIALEGMRNARKHARATTVRIEVSEVRERIVVTITDDGVGFPPESAPPWTIASHVAESGGQLSIKGPGPAHLEVDIPRS